MEKMKIVIDIPEKTYLKILNNQYDYGDMNIIIQNGVTLPENHGRLIDENDILKPFNKYLDRGISMNYWRTDYDGLKNILSDAPTIIEAEE